MTRTLLAIAAVVAGLAAPAHADTAAATTYAVVAIEIEGDADPTLREQVQAGMTRGVANAGADLIVYDDVQQALGAKPALHGCLSTTCLASIADVVGTTQLVRVRISANGANYELVLELLDAASGSAEPARRRTASCTVCTIDDIAALAEARVYDLLTAQTGAPLEVEITTQPEGATLDIPGVGVTAAPWQGRLAPGSYAVEARKDGYRNTRKELTVTDDGTTQRFEITLGVTAPPARFRVVKWATAGGALVLLVTGVVLIGMDGDPTCDGEGLTCPERYTTGTAGALFGVLGLAGAGAAGYMFWSDHRGRSAGAAVAPAETGGGATVVIGGRF